MTTIRKSGIGLITRSAEDLAPYNKWITWLKNIAIKVVRSHHLPIITGYKYTAYNYWELLIIHSFYNLPLDETADEHNQLLYDIKNKHCRHKVMPKIFNDFRDRKERLCPNGDNLRKYRNTLPKYIIDNLNWVIFKAQVEFALDEGLITKTIDIIVDNSDQWYYGSDRFPDNPYITKGHNGPGTSRKRKYLGVMLKCGTTYLYVGVDIIKKGHSNVPKIMDACDKLLKIGLNIRYLIADRWFPTMELLLELPSRNIQYIGPYKKYAPIKKIIENYIQNGGDYINKYRIKGAPSKHYKKFQTIWLILTNRQGRRLREIRKDYLDGNATLSESMKEIMVMCTTKPPPKGKKACQGWAHHICDVYDHRWQIETGFKDLNRISPPSNARTNERKLLMFSVRYWVYNCWQIERARRKKLKRVLKSWRKGPTLRRFTYCIERIECVC